MKCKLTEAERMYKMCLNKSSYYTSKEANKVARKRSLEINKVLRVYHCPYCNKYHLTSKPIEGEIK